MMIMKTWLKETESDGEEDKITFEKRLTLEDKYLFFRKSKLLLLTKKSTILKGFKIKLQETDKKLNQATIITLFNRLKNK